MSLIEETQNCLLIRNVLSKKQIELANMQKEIFKICEDPLMIDEYLADYKKRLFNLDFHKNTPYFARIKFFEKYDNSKYDIYISKLGYYKIDNDISLVDWRSPVCDLYYNGEIGDTKYRVDKDEIDANLTLKRQINFENGNVDSIYDFDDQISSDDLLKPYLTKHADTRLKNIVSTIQKEQNKIIRYPFHKNLIVQGVAGSGKTTVALHRLSYLLYNYKKQFKPYQYMILSPNKVFKEYVSSILPELDAQDVCNSSLENLAKDLIGFDIQIKNKNAQKDFLTKNNINCDYITFKSNQSFLNAIDKYVNIFEQTNFLKPLHIKNTTILQPEKTCQIFDQISAKNSMEKLDMFCKKISMLLQNNLNLRYQILDDLHKENKLTFVQKSEMNKMLEKGCETYLKKNFSWKINVFALYKDFISNIEQYTDYSQTDILKKYTLANLNKKIIAYEDIGGILYLYSKLKDLPDDYKDITNIFVDEAQDLSFVIFVALSKLFPQSYFSIFGDMAQGMYSYQSIQNWQELSDVFSNADFLQLDKSYRTTIEIMENANLTLQKLNMPLAQNILRHGKEVEQCAVSKQNLDNKVKYFAEQLKTDGYKTIAIIFKNDAELDCFCQQNKIPELVRIDENTENYESLFVALTVKTAKGLEFDSVIIYNLSSYDQQNSIDLKELFVAKTRALHKLIILEEL